MGAWGAGSFDNDDACDLVVRLEREGASAVLEALQEVTGLEVQDFLHVDSASAAIGAAEIVAAARDGDRSRLPEPTQEWLDEHGSTVASDTMAAMARRAAERVLLRSELKDLWQEGGTGADTAEWEEGVRALIERLKAKPAKAPKAKAGGRKQGFDPGAVLRVDLDGEWHVYARMLAREPKFAFYDCHVTTAEDPLDIVKRPVLFVLAVNNSRHWPKIGHVPLAVAPVPIPEVFVQSVGSDACEIIDEAWNARPATPQECVGLERAAVWSPHHVEERIRDHYAGRPNAYMSYMKVRLGGS